MSCQKERMINQSDRINDVSKSSKLELGAYALLTLLACVFPVLVFYIVPLVVIDVAAPVITQNFFTS